MRGGPVSIGPTAGSTLARFSLDELASGLLINDCFWVEVVVWGFETFSYAGSAACYVPVQVGAGVYFLGTVSYIDLYDASGAGLGGGTGGNMWDSLSLDQSGGDLRVEIVKSTLTDTCLFFVVATTFGP